MTIYKVSQLIEYLENVLKNEGDMYVVNNLSKPISVSRDWDDDVCIE